MPATPFTVGQHVKTRDGRDARVICVDVIGAHKIVALIKNGEHESIVGFYANGHFSCDSESASDLIPPKRSGTFWFNIYQDGSSSVPYSTEGGAQTAAAEDPHIIIAVAVPLRWTDGDGL